MRSSSSAFCCWFFFSLEVEPLLLSLSLSLAFNDGDDGDDGGSFSDCSDGVGDCS